jgi:Spy/CpxP family protein refolding chaperone
MFPRSTSLLAVLILALPGTSAGQESHGDHRSPYVDMQDRAIKALSSQDLHSLRQGEGMGFALAAELNGYPGPKHALEMAEALGLSSVQTARVDSLFRAMNEEARRLGSELISMEQALDEAFAEGTIDRDGLERLVTRAARLRGELRLVHLETHLRMMDILDRHQVRRYRELRGYGGHRHDGHGTGR